MIRTILWALAILGLLLLLQTTVLGYFSVWGFKLNLLWIVFVILAAQNGSFSSQIVGFVVGLAVDLVSLSPLGFHAFLFSLAGYLFGLGTGKVYFDPIVMPGLFGFLATLYDSVGSFVLNGVFRLGQPLSNFFYIGTLFHLLLNIILGPVIFWLYGVLKERFSNPRRGFGG